MTDQEQLKLIVYYDLDTGVFTWKKRDIKLFKHCKFPKGACNNWNARYANKECKTVTSDGYRTIMFQGKAHVGKRLAWLYVTGKFPDGKIVNIDRNCENNVFSNLEDVRAKECARRFRRVGWGSESGVKGVFRSDRELQPWKAQITVDSKVINLGRFKRLKDAIECRKAAEVTMWK